MLDEELTQLSISHDQQSLWHSPVSPAPFPSGKQASTLHSLIATPNPYPRLSLNVGIPPFNQTSGSALRPQSKSLCSTTADLPPPNPLPIVDEMSLFSKKSSTLNPLSDPHRPMWLSLSSSSTFPFSHGCGSLPSTESLLLSPYSF